MRVITKLRLSSNSILIFAITFIVSAVFLISDFQKAQQEQRLAQEITVSSFQLMLLQNEYLLYPSDRPKIQWYAVHQSLVTTLKEGKPVFLTGQEQLLFENTLSDFSDTKMLFDELVGAVEQGRSETYKEQIKGQLYVKAHQCVSNMLTLSEVSNKRSVSTGYLLQTILFVLAGILIMVSILSYRVSLSMSRAIRRISEGTKIIGGGNLDYKIEIKTKDEFGTLTVLLNEMTEKLKAFSFEITEEKEKYKELIQKIQVAVIVHGADTKILVCNSAAQELLGLTEDQMLGKTSFDPHWNFFREDNTIMPAEEYPVNKVFADYKTLRNYTVRIHRPLKKNDVWVLVNADPVFDKEGRLSQIITTFVDISELKKQEDEQKRLEKEVLNAMRALKAVSVSNQLLIHATEEVKLLKDICQALVEAGYRMAWVGYKENDEAKTVRPIVSAGYEEGYLDTAKITWAETERGQGPTGKAIRSGQISIVNDIRIDPNYAPWRDEAVKRGYASSISLPININGTIGALNIYASETNLFNEEEIKILSEFSEDIAFGIKTIRTEQERKKAETKLQESREMFKSIAEASPMAIILATGIEQKIIYYNPAFTRLFGYTMDDVPDAAHWWPRAYPGRVKQIGEEWLRRIKVATETRSSIEPMEVEVTCKNGSTKNVIWSFLSLGETNLSFGFDFTERKKAEEQLKELDRLKDDFLSVATHELKSPLVPIRSQAELLLAGDYGELNEKQKEAVEMIYRNENVLNLLTGEIFDIAKIKSKQLKLILNPTNLGKVVTESLYERKNLSEKKHLSLSLLIEPEIPEIIADELRIRQVVVNLLDNAIKFTAENGIVGIEVKKVKNEILLIVKDSGVGLSNVDREKIFVPFFQVESDAARKYRGTGLGLAISKGIVEAHGGKIWVESEGRGKGSTFMVSLPIK